MNDGMMVFVDVDSDPSTFNSSSAFLEFSKENGANSSCTKVLFAGLYWSGRGPSDIILIILIMESIGSLIKESLKLKDLANRTI